MEGTGAVTRHSFSSQGMGPREEGASRPQGAPLRLLGVTSAHASHPHPVASAQSLLVLKPPTGLLKRTERLSNSAMVSSCSV